MSPNSGTGLVGLLLFAAAGLFTLLSLLFWVWMLIDCIREETDEGSARILWAIAIAVINVPAAGLYFFLRRLPRRSGSVEAHEPS